MEQTLLNNLNMIVRNNTYNDPTFSPTQQEWAGNCKVAIMAIGDGIVAGLKKLTQYLDTQEAAANNADKEFYRRLREGIQMTNDDIQYFEAEIVKKKEMTMNYTWAVRSIVRKYIQNKLEKLQIIVETNNKVTLGPNNIKGLLDRKDKLYVLKKHHTTGRQQDRDPKVKFEFIYLEETSVGDPNPLYILTAGTHNEDKFTIREYDRGKSNSDVEFVSHLYDDLMRGVDQSVTDAFLFISGPGISDLNKAKAVLHLYADSEVGGFTKGGLSSKSDLIEYVSKKPIVPATVDPDYKKLIDRFASGGGTKRTSKKTTRRRRRNSKYRYSRTSVRVKHHKKTARK
jgi:hypothetical protein